MKKYYYIIISVVVLFIGIIIGRYTVPTKIEVQERYLDRIILKTDETQIQQLNQQISLLRQELLIVKSTSVKTLHVIKRPDGTVETTSRTVTDSETNQQKLNSLSDNTTQITATTRNTSEDKLSQKEIVKIQTKMEPQWHVSVLGGIPINNVNIIPTAPYIEPLYLGVMINRRVIGPFYVGVWVLTNKSAGMTLGVEF